MNHTFLCCLSHLRSVGLYQSLLCSQRPIVHVDRHKKRKQSTACGCEPQMSKINDVLGEGEVDSPKCLLDSPKSKVASGLQRHKFKPGHKGMNRTNFPGIQRTLRPVTNVAHGKPWTFSRGPYPSTSFAELE